MEDALIEFETYFQRLQSLEAAFYPKTCNSCGKVYKTPESFLLETRRINNSNFKVSEDDNGATIIEVFRNCTCGSTLLGNYAERRDLSPEGVQRRKIFDELHAFLVAQGMNPDIARQELRHLFRGQHANLQLGSRQ